MAEKFKGNIINLSYPEYSSLTAFKSSALKLFHTIPDDTDDIGEAIENVVI